MSFWSFICRDFIPKLGNLSSFWFLGEPKYPDMDE